MICSRCGQEVKENCVKFPKLGIEVDFTQEQNDTKFKDIKIRKGWS